MYMVHFKNDISCIWFLKTIEKTQLYVYVPQKSDFYDTWSWTPPIFSLVLLVYIWVSQPYFIILVIKFYDYDTMTYLLSTFHILTHIFLHTTSFYDEDSRIYTKICGYWGCTIP